MTSRKSCAILITLLFLGGVASSSFGQTVHSESYEKGKAEAAENLKNEKLVLKTWGLSQFKIVPWESVDEINDRLLKEKYKITIETVGGCMVDEKTADYFEGYNEVMQAGIDAKFGVGVLEKTRRQAHEEYEVKYGEMDREFSRKFREGIESLPRMPAFEETLRLVDRKPTDSVPKKPEN